MILAKKSSLYMCARELLLLFLMMMMHTSSVLSLHLLLKKLRGHNETAIDLSNANPAHAHKEVRRSTVHTSWWQPATQTSRDPTRDNILTRSNHPRTSETYRRQDDVLGYELQFFYSLGCCQYSKI